VSIIGCGMKEPEYIAAHRHSSRHRKEIAASQWCGCFYCMAIFKPELIEIWLSKEQTALCPKCGIDSVIGSQSGYPITREFLQKMHRHWFETTVSWEEVEARWGRPQ
jgi:hypothetical protein